MAVSCVKIEKKTGEYIFFKRITLRLHLGIGIVSCRLLQQMARMDMDWILRLKKNQQNNGYG